MNKKISTSQKRIKELMQYYGINQTELCRRTGVQKSALSNYLNGDRTPRQKQISLIADPFNINPAWLMGYEAPMFLEPEVPEDSPRSALIREMYKHFPSDDFDDPETISQIMQFIEFLGNLSPEGRIALLEFAKTLKF